jgi:hypothetical protein
MVAKIPSEDEVPLDVVVAQHPRSLGDVERALAKGHPVGVLQPAGEGDHPVRLALLLRVLQRVDVALAAGADEERARRAEAHLAGVDHPRRVGLDVEARRQADPVQVDLRGGRGRGKATGCGEHPAREGHAVLLHPHWSTPGNLPQQRPGARLRK